MRRNAVRFGLACMLALLPGFLNVHLHAQTPTQEPAPYTLRVVEIIIQVPVLVVSPAGERLPPPNPANFTVSLDGGRPMRPSHVRPQGDDPIDLAILIDGNGKDEQLLPHLAAALAALVPRSLHPTDSVVLYALGCQLTRISVPLPAVPTRIQSQAELAFTRLAKEGKHPCGSSRLLVSALAFIIKEQAQSSGRHVLLALTNGYPEFTSANDAAWLNLQHFADRKSVSLFALVEQNRIDNRFNADKHLSLACQESGGLTLHAYASELQPALVNFLGMLRERSILEFRRPGKLPSGHVDMEVKLKHSYDVVLAGGTTVSVPNTAEEADPSLFHPDPSLAPEVGKRHILRP